MHLPILSATLKHVQVALQISHEKMIKDNRNALQPIIVFCGTHDLPLRGKEKDDGVFRMIGFS